MTPGDGFPIWVVIVMIALAWAVCAALLAFVSLLIVGLWIPLQAWEQPEAQASIAARFEDRWMRFGPFRGFLAFYLRFLLLLISALLLLIVLVPFAPIALFWEDYAGWQLKNALRKAMMLERQGQHREAVKQLELVAERAGQSRDGESARERIRQLRAKLDGDAAAKQLSGGNP